MNTTALFTELKRSFLLMLLIFGSTSANAGITFHCEGKTEEDSIPVVIDGSTPGNSAEGLAILVQVPSVGVSASFTDSANEDEDQIELDKSETEGVPTYRLFGHSGGISSQRESIYQVLLVIPQGFFDGTYSTEWKSGLMWVYSTERGYSVDDGAEFCCTVEHTPELPASSPNVLEKE